ncbi:MAG: lytic murein transglycosylase, partial [Xanthobacteraceae bacterium]
MSATAASLIALTGDLRAQSPAFTAWVEKFHARARTRGISDATYTSVMSGLVPDTSAYALLNNQDEFQEQLWQYLNRRASDWRVITGK